MESKGRAAELKQLLESMTASVSSTRMALKSAQESHQALNVTEGISLLSLKHHLLISYLRSLALVSSHRVLAQSLAKRSKPQNSFSNAAREQRGNGAGDLVDSMIESRIVLEKVEIFESRMRYQIQKLLKIAAEPDSVENISNDPLAFRPNPQNLVNNDEADAVPDHGRSDHQYNNIGSTGDAIYRPPHLAPVPYVEKSKNQSRRERPPVPSALAGLSSDLSRPHAESSSGLGGAPSLASGRAKYLKRLTEFEEENFSRVVMKKSDAKRRARDEADIALGGDLGGSGGRGRRQAGGLEDEFGDVLRSVSRVSYGTVQGDGYEELRKKGKKQDVLSRSKRGEAVRKRDNALEDLDDEGEQRTRKRTRFELAAKISNKKVSKRKK